MRGLPEIDLSRVNQNTLINMALYMPAPSFELIVLKTVNILPSTPR